MIKIAELETQLRVAQSDREKIDLLNEIVFLLRQFNPRRSRELIQQIDSLLVQNPDHIAGRMMLLINQSEHLLFQGNVEQSLSQLREATAWCREHQFSLYLARALNNLGLCYSFTGEPAAALETLFESLSIAEQLDARLEQSIILSNLGVAHAITGIPERIKQALTFTQQALALAKEIDDTYGITLVLNNLSAIFLENTDFEDDAQSLKYGRESLEYAQKDQNHYCILLACSNLAQITERDVGQEYLEQGRRSLEQMKAMGASGVPIAHYYFTSAILYYRWGNLSAAQASLIEGIQVSREGHVRRTEYLCHELLATIHEQRGDFAKALEHYKQFHLVKEQVFNNENESKFKRLSANYQLKQAQAEAHYQKSLFLEEQRHSQRLQLLIDELESFSYSVSHDLRAPLRSITGFSQILLEDFAPSLSDEGQGYLHKIVRAGQRMDSLINDLLRLSRVTRAEIQILPIDLTLIASDIARQLQETNPNRHVEWLIQPDIRAEADSNLLRVALENLLNNAWKYTSKCQDARIEFGCRQDGEECVYYVRDNGAGFDMAYAQKLFKVFQRLHRAEDFEGTGVGLATVKRVIERHNGRIWAESLVDHGATFFFTLSPANS